MAAGQPGQIYLREAGRRRRPWLALALLVILLIAGLAALYALAKGQAPQPQRAVRVLDGKRAVASAPVESLRRLSAAQLRRWLRVVPGHQMRRRGRSVVVLRLDRAELLRRARRVLRSGEGGDVLAPRRAVAANVRLPIIKQALRNNCETAALSMLLVARGERIGQLRLQRQLARSKPLDPTSEGGRMVWGDPSRGFVGRPDGGGPAGGYGVYQRPIVALAGRHRVSLRDLSERPASIYRTLLQGRPVMAWVGLSDGPFRTWATPAGKTIAGNLGEHTVVLTGLSGQRLKVNDPLSGRRLTWSTSQFETMWRRLGRRALTI